MNVFKGDYETDKGVRVTISHFNKSLKSWIGFSHAYRTIMNDTQYRFNVDGVCTSHPEIGKLMRQRRGVEVW